MHSADEIYAGMVFQGQVFTPMSELTTEVASHYVMIWQGRAGHEIGMT
jgi:bifunctional pyridoxal-dependent enzyme with beta-cystathionase and maltose regulon repressor activities